MAAGKRHLSSVRDVDLLPGPPEAAPVADKGSWPP